MNALTPAEQEAAAALLRIAIARAAWDFHTNRDEYPQGDALANVSFPALLTQWQAWLESVPDPSLVAPSST